MRILSIETSCDETGLAILDCEGGARKPQFKIIEEVVASQIKIHRPWGGVVPNLAKREHLKNLPILYKKVFGTGAAEKKLWKTIDLIAVTAGPGLEPALWTGINFAEELAKKWEKPLLGANHMEGHLYSVLLPKEKVFRKAQDDRKSAQNDAAGRLEFPAVALVVSGGHTILLRMDSMKTWKRLGETRDDAAGEAFDKVARLLKLPYPGGPEISKLAEKGNSQAIEFPQPMLHSGNYEFSFSGLKTSVLYYLKNNPRAKRADVAASFEFAAINVLVEKTFRAVTQFKAKAVWLSGGVAANKLLREMLTERGKKIGVPLVVADLKHNTDNAAMIAAGAYMQTLRRKKYPLKANSELSV